MPSRMLRPSPRCVLPRRVPLAPPRVARVTVVASSSSSSSSSPAAAAAAMEEEERSFESFFEEDADAAMVVDARGVRVSLVDFVATENRGGNVVVLGWLRHFGCTLCKKQACEWKQWEQEDWVGGSGGSGGSGGLTVALVGHGPLEHAREFSEEVGWENAMFVDASRKSYARMRLRHGLRTTFNAAAGAAAMRSMRQGYAQTWARLSTGGLQQGGALVVDRRGVVTMLRADAFAGDHISRAALSAAVRRALADADVDVDVDANVD